MTLFLKVECICVTKRIFVIQQAILIQILKLFDMIDYQHIFTSIVERLKLQIDLKMLF